MKSDHRKSSLNIRAWAQVYFCSTSYNVNQTRILLLLVHVVRVVVPRSLPVVNLRNDAGPDHATTDADTGTDADASVKVVAEPIFPALVPVLFPVFPVLPTVAVPVRQIVLVVGRRRPPLVRISGIPVAVPVLRMNTCWICKLMYL